MRREIFIEALNSIKSNYLRTILTISIIGIGITALVGAMTATMGLEFELQRSIGKMGGSCFHIRRSAGERSRRISYREAKLFRGQYDSLSLVTVYTSVELGFEGVSASGRGSSPEVAVICADGGFIPLSGGNIAVGRGFSGAELGGTDVCIVGARVASMLYDGRENGVGEYLSAGGKRFRVVGVLGEMGSGGGSLDNVVLVPLESARGGLLSGRESFSIGILPPGEKDMDRAVEDAVAVMRRIRGVEQGDEDDFQISRRDVVMSKMRDVMGMVNLAAFLVGAITLLGASAGLMNIMLVSVQERRREIGVRKAIGASDREIGALFLCEAVIIGCAGGIAGVVLGLGAGGVVCAVMEIPFVLPWGWIGVSLVVSMAVCLISGSLPARRAAALPPIEVLRGV